jgi:hypothetical protein
MSWRRKERQQVDKTLEELVEELLGRLLVPTTLHQNIEHVATARQR